MGTHGPNNKDARRHHGKRSQKRLFLVTLLFVSILWETPGPGYHSIRGPLAWDFREGYN